MQTATQSKPIKSEGVADFEFITQDDRKGSLRVLLNGRINLEIQIRDYDLTTRKYGKPIARKFPFTPINPEEINNIRDVKVTPRRDYVEISFKDELGRPVMRPFELAYPERNQRYI
ncbi:hypothetical protein FJZ17_04320 [Candidatus Pacearchaeota archaeon]|nr:hypothetical protein [Candidatus Pacearchaeota archaeon]